MHSGKNVIIQIRVVEICDFPFSILENYNCGGHDHMFADIIIDTHFNLTYKPISTTETRNWKLRLWAAYSSLTVYYVLTLTTWHTRFVTSESPAYWIAASYVYQLLLLGDVLSENRECNFSRTGQCDWLHNYEGPVISLQTLTPMWPRSYPLRNGFESKRTHFTLLK